ncbi:MAG: hypothetical protein OXI59_19830 [Gemmatimonadota bacterium]|nr:hypothetical protein [Gemmatimonadota bacterium]
MTAEQRAKDIECFYKLLKQLEKRVGGKKPKLKEFMSVVPADTKGVYFIFETGEYRHRDGCKLRVVRVGSHGFTAKSRSTIWTRLFEHLMPYGRSVFRDHVRVAMKKRSGKSDSLKRDERDELERCITRYIGEMPFLWVKIGGADGHRERRDLERSSIKLLSARGIEGASESWCKWLGMSSNKVEIRSSGLWNVQHTKRRDYQSGFLDTLKSRIEETEALSSQDEGSDSPMCADSIDN